MAGVAKHHVPALEVREVPLREVGGVRHLREPEPGLLAQRLDALAEHQRLRVRRGGAPLDGM
jgi:hypothetical protein